MKYLFFVVLFISLFAISCDEDKEVLRTEADTALTVHDESEIKNILSGINNNSRAPDGMAGLYYKDEQAPDPLTFVDHLGRNTLCNIDPNDGFPCGGCPGLCGGGKSILTGYPQGSTHLSTADYNAGLRLYTLTLLKERQTGDLKLLFDTKYINDLFDNGYLVLATDLRLSSQMAARFNRTSITLKAGRYALVVDQTTGHGQTVVDLQ